jgi:hypothetical protein
MPSISPQSATFLVHHECAEKQMRKLRWKKGLAKMRLIMTYSEERFGEGEIGKLSSLSKFECVIVQ